MFCPQCSSDQSDELRFCKKCGANLHAVRQALLTRETGEKSDWSKTWLNEMLLSEDERELRKHESELRRGITPEVKRYNEIKAGVITSCVGIGVMIFLYIFMQGVILGGDVKPDEAEILRRIWVAGVIPFLIGVGLMFNGLFVSKHLIAAMRRDMRAKSLPATSNITGKDTEQLRLQPADPTEFIPSDYSVTEDTTRQLRSVDQKR